MRRMILLFSVVAVMIVFGSGVALAEELVGTEGPDELVGGEGVDSIYGLGDDDFLGGDPARFGPGGGDL